MTTYAQVSDGSITAVALDLPTTYSGIANFDTLDAATLATYGWYAVSDPGTPTYDPDTQRLGQVDYTPVAGGVAASVAVSNLDAASVAISLIQTKAELCAQIDGIVNSKCNLGLTFGGKAYQSDPVAVQRLQAAATAALAAVVSGHGAAGNLRWADPDTDFAWISTDNSLNTMDAPTMLGFYSAAITIGQKLILFGRSMKNQVLAAGDFPTLRAIDVTAGWP